MERCKRICKKLFSPPLWGILTLTLLSTAALITVFVKGWESQPIAYVTYPLSAYTLSVVCVFCTKTLPGYYRRAKKAIYNHPYGNLYMTDTGYRVRVSLYISLAINLTYAAMKLVFGVVYASFWLGALAVYYVLLSLLRFLLLRYMRANKDRQELLWEYQRCRLCGFVMLVLNLSLTGMVFQMVWQNKGYTYPGFLIFAVAAYTFYAVTISIVDLIRYRKYNSPVMSAAKAIRFASALVSLLTMETAMLAQFGDDDAYRRLMTALTGSAVCIIVLGISIRMIRQAGKEIKKLQTNEPYHF